MIKGIDITLFEETQTGVDRFNAPIYAEFPITVSNVVVAPTSSADILSMIQIHGKKAVYQLLIPKGDVHEWEGKKVYFTVGGVAFTGRVFGFVDAYIDSMVPGMWNKRAWVEKYG